MHKNPQKHIIIARRTLINVCLYTAKIRSKQNIVTNIDNDISLKW